MSLFDEQDLAEISHPDYPGERLVACRNPALAEQRARKRNNLLTATEDLLAPILTAVTEARLTGADKIGLKVGKVIDKYKMAKHFNIAITDTTLTITRHQASIDAEAALDGIYVIRTSVSRRQTSTPPTWSSPTKTCPMWNATGATSKSTTLTCGPSTTDSPTASKLTS